MSTPTQFLGSPYPITKDSRGFLFSQSGLAQIRSDLLILLLTNPGERVMTENFGTPLRKLIFEPNTPALTTIARQMIIDAISAWEPRITVQDITVTSTIDPSLLNPYDNLTQVNNILSINISFFDPSDIQSVFQLSLELPLGGS